MIIGSKLGEIIIQKQIGLGGMGSVYLGFHQSLHIPVAIKFLHKDFINNTNVFARFRLEARALAKLNHPNVVRVLDFVTNHTEPYIVQEYIDGEDLFKYLKKKGKLEPQEAIRIIMEVAMALKACHNIGIIHRDIKPHNIFIAKDGTIKLGDFGIVTPFDGSMREEEGILIGTPSYMSPEQYINAAGVDERTDIYSLGLVFCELITGVELFADMKIIQILHKKIYNEIKIPKSVPEYIEPILSSMLQKNKDERMGSVDNLLDALRLVYDPMLGTDICGYKLVKIIGKGGQGKVYLACSLNLNENVAIKILLSDESIKPEARKRFQLEGKISKYLDHENIVKVREYGEAVIMLHGESKIIHFIIMDFIKGLDLEDFINLSREKKYETAICIIYDVLSALNYAHQNGLIHRDVKPRNILISKDGQTKITDFGLCKYTNEYNPKTSFSISIFSNSSTMLGSPHFMSPEQIKNSKDVNKLTDIYSAGVVLFYLCTHQFPFTGETPMNILINILTEPIPDIKKLNNTVPDEVVTMIKKMIDKNPQNRYQSCQEVRNYILLNFSDIINKPINLSEKDIKEQILSQDTSVPTIFAYINSGKAEPTLDLNDLPPTLFTHINNSKAEPTLDLDAPNLTATWTDFTEVDSNSDIDTKD